MTTEPRPGEVFAGRHELIDRIGEGGMAMLSDFGIAFDSDGPRFTEVGEGVVR